MTAQSDLRNRLTALTRDLILIPSTESRPKERERCLEFIENHLDGLGAVRLTRHQSNGYGSLLAMPGHTDMPDVLLCGHVDVVEHPDADCYHSVVRAGRIQGPGAGDMKGAIAIILDVFRLLHERSPGMSLGLAITSDEERGGEDGVGHLCQQIGLRCGVAIIPDAGSPNEVTVEEKGALHLKVRVQGRAAHGARPWLGANAVQLLMQRLVNLGNRFGPLDVGGEADGEDPWIATCSPTVFHTQNESVNRIPAAAEASLDIRFPPPQTVESMLEEVSRALGPQCELEVLIAAEPTHLEPDDLFCQVTEQITNKPIRLVRASGGSDARFLRQYEIPVNLSRPLVGNLHAQDEWIDIDSMVTFHDICRTYILRRLAL